MTPEVPRRTPTDAEGVPFRVPAGPLVAEAASGGFWERNAVTPLLGDEVAPGVRAVHFLWRGEPGREAIVHLNSVTDRHRENVAPARFRRVGGDVWQVGFALADTLAASYRIAVMPRIADDAGRTRPGWLAVHGAGLPDPGCPERLPNPLGGQSSVLRMPRSRQHPAWAAARRGDPVRAYPPVRLATRHPAWLLAPPGRVTRVLLLFDAENWLALALAAALAHRAEPGLAVVLIGSGTPVERAGLLPRPALVSHLVAAELLPAVRDATDAALGPGAVIAAGQSFGGLAAAGLVVLRPDLVGSAIVQSASFQYVEGRDLPRFTLEPGDLVRGMGRATGRVHVQAGTEEDELGPLSRVFADRADGAGMAVSHELWSGGHDYAWWTDGLFAGLDAL
ncbi:MAG: enterochelin esterase domain-containing protein [Propionicimonas sp.]